MSIPESLNIRVIVIHSHTFLVTYYTVIINNLQFSKHGHAFLLSFMLHSKLGSKVIYITVFKIQLFYYHSHIYSQYFFKYSFCRYKEVLDHNNMISLSCTTEITIISSYNIYILYCHQ